METLSFGEFGQGGRLIFEPEARTPLFGRRNPDVANCVPHPASLAHRITGILALIESMIPKSGDRFSEKIMLQQ
jgi:hypothetical protein